MCFSFHFNCILVGKNDLQFKVKAMEKLKGFFFFFFFFW